MAVVQKSNTFQMRVPLRKEHLTGHPYLSMKEIAATEDAVRFAVTQNAKNDPNWHMRNPVIDIVAINIEEVDITYRIQYPDDTYDSLVSMSEEIAIEHAKQIVLSADGINKCLRIVTNTGRITCRIEARLIVQHISFS